jgi:hypothetical protein
MNVRRRPAVRKRSGRADGFRRIARRTGITATKVHIRAGEVLTTEARVRPGVGTTRMGAAIPGVDGPAGVGQRQGRRPSSMAR